MGNNCHDYGRRNIQNCIGWKKIQNHINVHYKSKINKLDITNFLSTFIKDKKNKISVKKISSAWYEIDNQKDLMVAKKYFEK